MNTQALREALRKLHEELARTPSVDGESRKLLSQLAADIQRLADQPSPSGARSHLPRLDAAEAKFEAEHPKLAEALREIVDAFGKAGL